LNNSETAPHFEDQQEAVSSCNLVEGQNEQARLKIKFILTSGSILLALF